MEKQYQSAQAEIELRQLWHEKNIYAHTQSSGKLYSIDTPPPTVSGSLHIGHIFSYTQTDIIARYQRMKGRSVYYPFGFDDNGLPTERYVEKEKNIQAFKLSRSEFIALCLEQTHIAEQAFQELWQKMGLSINWKFWYSTISPTTRKIAQSSFIDLYKKGFVYRADEPALYCSTCRTTIAQAELDDKETATTFYDIIFKDENGNDLIIATTRPELLYSCVAVLFHPGDSRYQHLTKTKAHIPLTGAVVPILPDESVIFDKGTGLVMCCTFGDKTDVEWYKRLKLPYKQTIGHDGKFIAGTGVLEGLSVHEGRKAIVTTLQDLRVIKNEHAITHAVNVHERCKKPVEYLIITQWFVRILPYKETLLNLGEQIEWHPSFMKARYRNWVENITWDWCISRQRFFGIPFPVWHCTLCNHMLFARQEELPLDPREVAPPHSVCPECKKGELKPDTDVMDTWNTSSLTPYIAMALLNPDASFFSEKNRTPFEPMSMRPQAHDIIRTWAFYTIAKTWMHHNVIPWKQIVISGHVLSSQKEKLSKSKGNTATDPNTLISQYSADAIRYWTASGTLGHDVSFSDAQIRIGQKLVNKLWNAFKFIEIHAQNFELEHRNVPMELGIVNEWILDTTSHCFDRYQHYLDRHEFGLALGEVERFFWHDFCDQYLELIKHQMFNNNNVYSLQEVESTRWTLCHVGLRILQLYAPYVPYITDTIYQQTYARNHKESSIHLLLFSHTQIPFHFKTQHSTMQMIMKIVSHVRKLKTQNQLALSTPLSMLQIITDEEQLCQKLYLYDRLIRGVTHAQELYCNVDTMIESHLKQYDEVWQAVVSLNTPTAL